MRKTVLVIIFIYFSFSQIALAEEQNMNTDKKPDNLPNIEMPKHETMQWDKIKYVPDELLIQFKEPVDKTKSEEIFKTYGCELIRHSKTFDTYHLKIVNKKPVKEVVEAFNSDPLVKWAEPNVITNLQIPTPKYGAETDEKNL